MTDNKQFSISLEYIVLLCVLAVIYIATRFFPSASLLLIILSAAVISAIGMRFSFGMCASASVALLLANAITSLLMHEGIAGCVALPVLIPSISGFLGAYCLRKHYGLLKTTVITSLGAIAGVGIFAFTITRFVDPNFFAQIFEAMKTTIYELVDMLAEQTSADVNTTAQLKSMYVSVVQMMTPAVIIILCAAFSFLFPYLAKFYVRKRGDMQFEYQTSFSLIRADKVSALVPIVCLGLIMVIQSQILLVVLFNMVLVLAGGMFICGMSVISFYLKVYVKAFPVRLLTYIMVFLLPSAPMLVILLGIIDAFADFRHLKNGGGFVV
jgi:uncharacterized protein YybS (DUF2232 family)